MAIDRSFTMPDPVLRMAAIIERRLFRRLMRLPRSVRVMMAGPPPERDGQRLDDQAHFMIANAKRAGVRPMHEQSVESARATNLRSCLAVAPDSIEMDSVADRTLDGPAGAIPVRVYRPRACAGSRNAPALMWLHGGGFVVGDIEGYDALCRTLAEGAGCVVVSVAYRLAPEHRFPASVDDAVAAFESLRRRANEFGVDPSRIAVGGDSAGANLAAVICQQMKLAGKPQPAFQLLVYPVTEQERSSRSRELFAEGFFLERATIDWFRDLYFARREDAADVRASPLRADDVSNLAPAMVLTAGFDPLRDEGQAYAARLRLAGVPVELRNDKGMFHGYFSASGGMDVSKDAVAHAARSLRNALKANTSAR